MNDHDGVYEGPNGLAYWNRRKDDWTEVRTVVKNIAKIATNKQF